MLNPRNRKPPTDRRTGAGAKAIIFSAASSIAPLDKILPHLEKVRQTGPGKWMCRCPGPLHKRGDRAPSLSIRETSDGTLLIKCFAGCGAADIVASVGLELSDLFPSRAADVFYQGERPPPPKLRAADLLNLAVSEALMCAFAFHDIQAGKTLSDEDAARVDLALETLLKIYAEVRP
jgi:hypothetical protein